MSTRKLGILQIVLSGLCFGCVGYFAKSAYAQRMQPLELLSIRFLIGSFFLCIYSIFKFRNNFSTSIQLKKKELIKCLCLGTFGYGVFSSCIFITLSGLSASLSVLLLYTYPIIVSVGAYLFFGEKISNINLIALPLALGGLFLLVWKDIGINDPRFIFFGLASALFYSLYILLSSRWLKGIDPLISTFYIQLSAGLVLFIWQLKTNTRTLDEIQLLLYRTWAPLLGIGLICSAAAMTLFLMGLKKLKNWEASVLSTTEPLAGILIAIIFLGEKLSFLQFIGAFCVLSAIVFVALSEKLKKRNANLI